MSRFTPTTSNNPCPICEDVKGKCRSKEDKGKLFILCAHENASKGELTNGFRCINSKNRDLWQSTWIEDKENQEYSSESAEKHRKQREKEEKRYQAFLKSGLLRKERHTNIRQISENYGLSREHRQKLQARGLSNEAIRAGRFFSVNPGQFIPKGIDPKTPGVYSGNKLAVGQLSMACPAFNHQGYITGYQLRLDEATQNKYRWAKGKYPSHLCNGELPITVTRPTGNNPVGIGMCEGILKPFIAAQIHQKVFIGASGANFASSPEQFKIYLEAVSLELQTKIIDFYPDAGAVSNVHVVRSYRRTFDLLENLGYDVRVAWWNQIKKQDKDCDEIVADHVIQYLTLNEFEDVCIQHGGYIPSVEKSKEELTEEELEAQRKEEFYRKVVAAQRPLRTLSYKPNFAYKPDLANLPRDSKERYLPNLVGIVPESGILLIRAPKGSGKSHQIKAIKDYHCGHFVANDEFEKDGNTKKVKEFIPGLGKKFLSITPRVALGREQAENWEYKWIDDVSTSKTVIDGEELYQINEEVFEIGLCFDSLWKIANRDLSNHLMILDECELGLTHMISSSTLKRNRPLILKLFEEKVKECLENNGLLILSDADITDISVDYIRSICPNAPIFLVDYQGCPNPWEIEYSTGYQDEVEKLIFDWFDSEINPDSFRDPIFIATDSQDEAEALEKQLLKRYPEVLGGQIGGIIRIDSTVTQTDFGRDFVNFINKSIETLKPKVLIATPSLGVGVSIDFPWFKHVFGLFFGTVEPSQARQQLARVRQPVPRTVWARDVGNIERGIMGSFFVEEIKSNLFHHHESTSDLIGIALELAKDSIENQCDKDILPALVRILQGMMSERGSWDNKHVELRCKTQARRNFSMSQYALQLRQELIEEGHRLIDCGCPEKNSAGEDIREQKKEDKLTEARAIAEAPDIDLEVAKEKTMTPTRTTEEENQIQKAFLKDELPGVDLSPEFIHKAVTNDNGRWKAGVKLFWHCRQLEATKSIDLSEWRYKLKLFEAGLPFLPDIKTRSLQCKAILESGILGFISEESLQQEYIGESPEVRGFWQWAQSNKSLLQKAFGMAIGKEPIKLLNRLLLKVGAGLIKARSEKLPNGNKLRYYKLDMQKLVDPDRQAILQALDLRWQLRQEEKAKREQAYIEQQEIASQNPPPVTPQSQGDMVKSRCHDPYTYNILDGRDTAHSPCPERDSSHFQGLIDIFGICQDESDLMEVSRYYEPLDSGASSPDLKKEHIEAAILFTPLNLRGRLQHWWNSVCSDVMEFWRGLEVSAAGM